MDADPRDPFDFFLDHYNDQLVAGYDENLSDHGLLVHMPDYNKLGMPGPGKAETPDRRFERAGESAVVIAMNRTRPGEPLTLLSFEPRISAKDASQRNRSAERPL